jgi:hypothetical protein
MAVQTQTTQTVLMMQPLEFGFNPQTAQDNEFQHNPTQAAQDLLRHVTNEFIIAVDQLSQAGVTVLIPQYQYLEAPTPDAIFPNNWFSTRHDGKLITYPMATPNRRLEVERLERVQTFLREMGFRVKSVRELHALAEGGLFLEGTGSLVLDHVNQVAYAALSHRTDRRVLDAYCVEFGYKQIAFETRSSTGKPFYHTNVVMTIGEDWAVVCADSITPAFRPQVLDTLRQTHEVMEITHQQAEQFFCANLLELKSDQQERLLATSKSAWDGFTQGQQEWLAQRMKPVICPIPTIERVGGGSLRCMLAEIFLPEL